MREDHMPRIATWGGRSTFSYRRHVDGGVTVVYGNSRSKKTLTADQINELLHHFAGRSVEVGASRDAAPVGSLEDWLQPRMGGTATATYFAAALVDLRLAQRDDQLIKFS